MTKLSSSYVVTDVPACLGLPDDAARSYDVTLTMVEKYIRQHIRRNYFVNREARATERYVQQLATLGIFSREQLKNALEDESMWKQLIKCLDGVGPCTLEKWHAYFQSGEITDRDVPFVDNRFGRIQFEVPVFREVDDAPDYYNCTCLFEADRVVLRSDDPDRKVDLSAPLDLSSVHALWQSLADVTNSTYCDTRDDAYFDILKEVFCHLGPLNAATLAYWELHHYPPTEGWMAYCFSGDRYESDALLAITHTLRGAVGFMMDEREHLFERGVTEWYIEPLIFDD